MRGNADLVVECGNSTRLIPRKDGEIKRDTTSPAVGSHTRTRSPGAGVPWRGPFIEQRDRRVILRATTGEVAAWRQRARLEGHSFSELARDAINRYCRQAENAP